MHGDEHTGFTDAETAELADIIHEVEVAQTRIRDGQVAQMRALARAGDLARRQAERSRHEVREHEMALRAISAEVAGVMRASDRSVQRQIDDAGALIGGYPMTLAAWAEGRITRAHVRLIADLGTPLPPETRGAFEAVAIPACECDTPGRVRSRLQTVAERLHPRTMAERHRDARAARNVRVIDVGDGMSDLIATLPTVLAAAVYDRLTSQGRAVKDAVPQARTMDQIRADLMADMLLTAAPDADPTRTDDGPGALGAIRARVQVVVPALTLVGAEDGPADLVGRAPIDPDTARRLVAGARDPIERVLTHPVTGSVVEVDVYQRPASLDRYLRARDRHCRFPGCVLPAVRCDVDHTRDHARGGVTARHNLSHLCRRHHGMKHATPWRVRQLPDGDLEWTSPLGRVTVDRVTPPVAFVPDPPPSPADDAPF